MFTWLLITMTTTMILTIPLCTTPLSLGLWIWLLTLFLAFTISFIFNSWFAFILFLIYVGGLLVMFAYFSAIAPNQKMFIKQLMMNLISPFILLTALSIFQFNLMINFLFPTQTISPVLLLSNTFILSTLALVLLFAMIVVAKIAAPKFGPLRPFSLS